MVSPARKKESFRTVDSPIGTILHLQRTIGNQSVQRLFKSGFIQAKLTIGQPHYIYREEPVQPKANPGKAPAVAPHIKSHCQSLKGGGQSFQASIRNYYEPRFGRDFSQVQRYTDIRAGEAARTVHAGASTVGHDLILEQGRYAPETAGGRRVLAHEVAHIVQQRSCNAEKSRPYAPILAASPSPNRIWRNGLLSQSDITKAIAYNKAHYDTISVMIIQGIDGSVPVTGRVDAQTVEAIATFQDAYKTGKVTGMADEKTLNKMVPLLDRQGNQEEAIKLVMDFYNIPKFEALSIHYDRTIPYARTHFEAGVLRVVHIGRNCFRNATDLRDVIDAELQQRGPGTSITRLTKQRLSSAQVAAAIKANKRRLQDLRMIVAIQDLVGAPDTASIDAATVQHIAEYQFMTGLMKVTGIIDTAHTLPNIVNEMLGRGYHNTVIQLLIDYFDLRVPTGVIDIHYGQRSTVAYTTIPGPTILTIGLPAFARGLTFLVHMIAKILEHARLIQLGVRNRALRMFLGEAVAILSKGLPKKKIRDFMYYAARALRRWGRIARAQDRRRYWKRFEAVRKKVSERFNKAPWHKLPPVLHARFARLEALYWSVPPP